MSAGLPTSPANDQEARRLLSVAEGSLAETPFWRLLLAAAVLERSVVIELRRNALYKRVIIEQGVPVDSRSNIATESLGRFLVSQRRLSEEDYRACLAESVARDMTLEEVLVAKQVIAASDVYRLLQQNLGRKLLDAFAWSAGTFRISGSLPNVDTPLRVRVPQLILTGLLRFEPQERIDEVFAAVSEQFVVPASGPFDLADVRLSADQRRVVDAIGSRGERLADLIREGPSSEDIQRLIYAMLALGMVAFSDTRVEIAVPVEPPKPEVTGTEPAGAPSITPLLDRDDLIAAYMSFRRKDPLDLLEIPESAGIVQINRAWIDFARRFAPWQFPDDGDALREKAQELFFAGARAYGELVDPDRRAAVVSRRRGAEAAPRPPQASPERETLVDPEELYRRGRELSLAGKTREALGYFEMASDCDPQNGTYAAELAWSRFELMITTAALAMKALKNALRIDPRSGAANLYVGRIHSTLGNHLEAEGYVLKAAELMPRDPRVAEALRLVRSRGRG